MIANGANGDPVILRVDKEVRPDSKSNKLNIMEETVKEEILRSGSSGYVSGVLGC